MIAIINTYFYYYYYHCLVGRRPGFSYICVLCIDVIYLYIISLKRKEIRKKKHKHRYITKRNAHCLVGK